MDTQCLSSWTYLADHSGGIQRVHFGREEGLSRASREWNLGEAVHSDVCKLLEDLEFGLHHLPSSAAVRKLLALLQQVEAGRNEELGRRGVAVRIFEALAKKAPQ